MRGRIGQSALYTVLFLPIVVLVFALAVDIALLQLQRLRLHWALDMATVAAVTSVDAAAYTRTGRLRIDQVEATAVTREYLYRNLSQLGGAIGGDHGAMEIARMAEVAVINEVPARDPYSGVPLDRPAVSARIKVPYRLNLIHIFPDVVLTINANAEIKS